MRPSRWVPRPTLGMRNQPGGMNEWHFGAEGIFFIVGDRLEVVTVQWRQSGFLEQGRVELIESTSSVQTSAGFSRDHTYEDLMAIHGVPTRTRLDIFHSVGTRSLTAEYNLFDGIDDDFWFRVTFRDDLAMTLQFSRTSVFGA